MNIGIDMMGGDFAPLEAVKGLQTYLSTSNSRATLYCIGNEAELELLFAEYSLVSPELVIVHASQVIDMDEHATKAFKEKQDSSIAVGFRTLAAGKVDAFISAGNTGAMLVGAFYSIKAIAGVHRPAIASIVPKVSGATGILLDVGLNADCKPENLNQFALLGSLYAKDVFGIENPKVGLLNVGEEEGKGNILTQATYPLLKENRGINFIGNIEGRDVFLDKADVMICDGFTGNIILKMAESLYDAAKERNIPDTFMHRFNYEDVGGTPVLGVAKPIVIGHGISNATAFSNMILLAEKMVASNICGHIIDQFKA
ncbi:phosphate acyltransferase PlsX [Segetibacter aerophilus]|uniref:Phosphate acyltransferase n=1 Tax=Segetibacter aerophilus TaxID=670293 RepID=A0A512BA98_9BACT|nr:phosphate acyltransferase PlsX [Segetibacter aerophilus]GEO08886.1 phosphate acyltransferase [Segetibacter aerophilus]